MTTPPACESVKIKVEPLEQPPPPPTSLTRLIETAVARPSNGKLERCFVEGTPSQVVPRVWSLPSGPSPCTPAYYGVNSAYAVPVYYVPCVNQMPLQAAQLQPAVVASPFATYTPYQCTDSVRSQEMSATNDFIAEQETAHDGKTPQNDRDQQTPDDLDHSARSTCIAADDKPKPRRRDSSPPVLCTDSPRTIAYCYKREMADRPLESDHHFASAGSGQGRITGVPVFIQSKRSDGALLGVHPVDLFVAVSMIAGTAPSQHRLTATGCLLVDMPSVEGVNRLLHSEHLCGVEVKVSIPDAYQKSSSVIRGVPTSYTENELLDLLKPQGVIHVKRLVRYTVGGSAEMSKPTGKVVLTFPRNSERPGKVEIGDEEYKLREFVDRPARCYRCQRLGHVSKHCAAKLRCKRCCGPHDIKECPRDRPRRCANCGGPHYPSYKGCRAYAQMLRSVKSFLNVT